MNSARVKHLEVTVRRGALEIDEDAHELGWDIDRIIEELRTVGLDVTFVKRFPCDCEVCK